jgi:plastocyanin
MNNFSAIRFPHVLVGLVALAVVTFSQTVAAQQNWQAKVGAETPSMGRQALAFLPNELWIHAGDRVTWAFNSDEIHTVSFLVVGQPFPPFAGPFGGCPGFSAGSASFDGSTCVTTPPSVKGNPAFTVTFPSAGNFKVQCLVHNTMNGVVHVLDPAAALPHDQAFYDKEAANEQRNLLKDNDHAMSTDAPGMSMSHSANMLSVRVLAAKGRLSSGSKKLAASSGANLPANAHVTAGVGEIDSTPGGVQTSSLVRFVSGKIVVHVGDTVEWGNHDPEEPHTITFGPDPAGDPFPPSGNVTVDADGGLRATLNSPSDAVHSGFIEQALPDQPGLPANSNPDNAIGAPFNATYFRVTFMGPGTYNYHCVLHDNLGMVGQVVVVP